MSAVIPSPLRIEGRGGRRDVAAVEPHGFPAEALEHLGSAVPIRSGGVPLLLQRAAPDRAPALHPSGRPVDETHRIEVGPEAITVRAASDEGAFRALTTIGQLAREGSLPYGVVEDGPRFGWRGLCLDVARHPLPLPDLRRIVEILASLKLNVLHLHLTDDQGWRLPVPSRPELARVGGEMSMSGTGGFAYTTPEYAEFERWARDRHVWIVPEIDLPGHVGALIAAYPHLAAGSGVPGEYASRLHLDPRSEEVYELLGDVIDAVRQLHGTPYLHLGGDEAFGMDDADYATVLQRVVDLAAARGARPIAWQEAARAGAGIDVLQVWRDLERRGLETDPEVRRRLGLIAAADLDELTRRGHEDVARMSAEGRRAILSPALTAYLDRPYDDPAVEREGLAGAGLPIWRPGTVRDSFDFDVDDVVPGLDPRCIGGVEAALWTETIRDADTAERMLLPRLAGVAQRAWEHEPESWAAHADRLRDLRPYWDARGFSYFKAERVFGGGLDSPTPVRGG